MSITNQENQSIEINSINLIENNKCSDFVKNINDFCDTTNENDLSDENNKLKLNKCSLTTLMKQNQIDLENKSTLLQQRTTSSTHHHQQEDKNNKIGLNVVVTSTTASTTTTTTTTTTSAALTSTINPKTTITNNNTSVIMKRYALNDINNISFSSDSGAGSIQDDNMSDQCSLTQAGLEEYNNRSYYDQPVFHHQKQSSYAQSEGYHSYVSSSDSTSATPLLDRLRQESDLLSRQSHHWSENDLTSEIDIGDSIGDNKNSDTTSSTETLIYLGSVSDVSEAASSSALSESVSQSQLIVHSARVPSPKRHNSESVLYLTEEQKQNLAVSSNSESNLLNRSSSPNCLVRVGAIANEKLVTSSVVVQKQTVYSHQQQHHYHHHHQYLSPNKRNQSNNSPSLIKHSLTESDIMSQNCYLLCNGSNDDMKFNTSPIGSYSNGYNSTTKSPIHNHSPVSSTQGSPNNSNNQSYRSNHRLFPVSTYTEQPVVSNIMQQCKHQTSTTSQQSGFTNHQHSFQNNNQFKIIPHPGNWHSVADRVNNYEKQQSTVTSSNFSSPQRHGSNHFNVQSSTTSSVHHITPSSQKYSFIDPNKMHRMPNPQLKAFQKNAVQSYFERQQQHNNHQTHHAPQDSQQNNSILRPHSLQPQPSPKEVNISQIRNSLPTTLPNNHNHPNYNHGLSNNSAAQKGNYNISVNQHNHQFQSPHPHQFHHHETNNTIITIKSDPPPPPPRNRSLMPIRRSSSASDYDEFRENFINSKESNNFRNPIVLKAVTNPAEKSSFNDCGVPPPPPPPRGRLSLPIRRTSSASDYAAVRDKNLQAKQNSSKELIGPVIMGPIISVDDWVPERPPKNPQLRVPSPDLPPPPPIIIEGSLPDEPLPPPPPEILHYTRQNSSDNNEQKPPSPNNRRNSFAGSPSRKQFFKVSLFENMMSPPAIPKKPATDSITLVQRPASSLAQSTKAHKIVLNGKFESPIQQQNELLPKSSDIRLSVRKRPHIHQHNPTEYQPNNNKIVLNKIHSLQDSTNINCIKSPPPLKPRMPIAGQEMQSTSVAINNKLRCNSKASYLPRQSLDKLNITDPDHGSYKLTLTSNEDSVVHSSTTITNPSSPTTKLLNKTDEIIPTSQKCNLPDVLPVSVKIQPSSQRYSTNNISQPQNGSSYPSYPNMKLIHQKPPISSSPRPIIAQPKPNTPPPSYQSVTRNNFVNESKYISQSTIDLKKTQDSADEMNQSILSPAQSETNLNTTKMSSPFMGYEFQRTDIVRKLSLEEREPGDPDRIRNDKIKSTILSSAFTKSEEKISLGKDSLKDNIAKISQLQSKLMSAHTTENTNNNKILGYNTKNNKIETIIPPPLPEKEYKKQKAPSPILEIPLLKEFIEPSSSSSPKSPVTIFSSLNNSLVLSNDSNSSNSSTSSLTTNNCHDSHNDLPASSDNINDVTALIQRTEIILHVNPPTSEQASQTDDDPGDCETTHVSSSRYLNESEIDCDKIANELASLLPSTEVKKLSQILIPPKTYKSTADYVIGLYDPHMSRINCKKRDVGTSTPTIDNKPFGFDCDSLKKLNNHLNDNKVKNLTNGNELVVDTNSCDLTKKKEELINRLTQKLNLLNKEKAIITNDTAENDQLGLNLLNKLTEILRPIDITKFKTYVDDVGHITMLLLSLSGRLAKIENTLHDITENHPEKKILDGKKNRLTEQLEEAKRLKEDIDRRGILVFKITEKALNNEECSDYNYFINSKAKLIVNMKELSDKIKLNEEQLNAIRETLLHSEC